MILRRAWRPVAGLGSEHGAGDGGQAVRDGTQGAGANGDVLGLADDVELDRDLCPVVDCVTKTPWAAMRRTTSLYLPDRRVTDATPHMHRNAL